MWKSSWVNLVPVYEVNPIRFSHDPNKVIFNFPLYVLPEHKKSLLVKGLGFPYHLKRLNILTFLHNLNCYIGTL